MTERFRLVRLLYQNADAMQCLEEKPAKVNDQIFILWSRFFEFQFNTLTSRSIQGVCIPAQEHPYCVEVFLPLTIHTRLNSMFTSS